MASARIGELPPPQVDRAMAQPAYGMRALPKLQEELQGQDASAQLRALCLLQDEAHKPEITAGALQAGMLDSLLVLAGSTVADTRWRALSVLGTFATTAHGRQALLAADTVGILVPRFDDASEPVRLAAHGVLAALSAAPGGADQISGREQLVATLVAKVMSESPPVQCEVLETLQQCLRRSTGLALDAGVIRMLVSLLSSSSAAAPEVIVAAARALQGACVPTSGKEEAVDQGAVPVLVYLLGNSRADVRAMALGAIMNIAITTRAKFAFLRANAHVPLAALLDDTHEVVLLNAIKSMTVLAEAPEGRIAFAPLVPKLAQLLRSSGSRADPEIVARSAQKCIDVITWQP